MGAVLDRWLEARAGWSPRLAEPLLRLAFAHLEPVLEPAATVVDLGGGRGDLADALAASGAHVICLDIDPSGAERAKAVAERISFLVANAERIPLRDGAVDALFCFSVLQYTNRGAVLSECRRVLRAGGRFAVVENLAGNPIAQAYRYWRRLSGRAYPWNMTPRSHLRSDEVDIYCRHFATVSCRPFHVAAPAFAALEGRGGAGRGAPAKMVNACFRLTRCLDDALLAGMQSARSIAWNAVVYGVR
jgi:SAM-dependent methyltransferase